MQTCLQLIFPPACSGTGPKERRLLGGCESLMKTHTALKCSSFNTDYVTHTHTDLAPKHCSLLRWACFLNAKLHLWEFSPHEEAPRDMKWNYCRQRPQICLLTWGGCSIPSLMKRAGMGTNRTASIKRQATAIWGCAAMMSSDGCLATLCGAVSFSMRIFLLVYTQGCFILYISLVIRLKHFI